MLDGAVVIPLQSLFWNLLFEGAALLWMVDRALLSVGYFILTLTGWLSQHVFSPLLAVVSEQTGVLVGPIFLIALTVLGFTYLMAVFGRFEVVNFRSAVLWLLFAAALYTFGPNIYTGMEDFRRFVGSGFYQLGVDAFNDASGATGLNAIGTLPSDTVPIPSDQFGQFLPGVPGATTVDGLDVAMAYVGADGYDVLAASGSPHPIARLPWLMVEDGADGFFDPDTGPNAFPSMTDADRQASIGRALQGLWRAFTTLFIAIFGIIEQLVNFLMACSFAVAFFSMFIAVLFGFFVRTESIAWSALNLIIELFIQSIINSLLMSLILGFVMVGANTANAILLLGASLVGLWMSWNLLQGCIKGLLNSTERLYQSFSASTGGNFATVGETNKAIAEGTSSAATGLSVLAGGGSFLQALGASFGDARTAQTMNYASRILGGEDTLLGSMAQSIGEGASARSLAGPLGGYLLGKQTKNERQDERVEEKRRRYIGENDEARDSSLKRYLQSGDAEELESSFKEEDIPRIQALAETFEPEEIATVARSVRRLRNAHPELPPQSASFLGKLRQELPPPYMEMEAPALEDFAQVFGAAADDSPYSEARNFYTPPVMPIPKLGNADFARDDSIKAYRQAQNTGQSLPNLEDIFSPADAQRLAQLMDAYDDNDFAQVVYAVRAARESLPDAPLASSQVLQATRKNLPTELQKMPSRDLAAFSRAFGASAQVAALPDESLPPRAYLGQADRVRDRVVAAYRDGDESPQILEQVFNPQQARSVRKLADDYSRDDFDAVVQAVRQARTADPDMPSGSPQALRSSRKQLPQHLRQIPSEDLAAFSRAFGDSAEIPSAVETEGLKRPRSRRRETTESSSELLGASQANASLAESLSVDELPAIPSLSQQYSAPSVPPKLATEAEKALGLAATQRLTPLVGLRAMNPAQRNRLEQMGIASMEVLADTPVHNIASTAKVSEERAQEWRSAAKTVVKAQAARTRQELQALQNSPISSIQPMPGLATRRIQRLAEANITTMEALVQADTAQVAQILRVSPNQVQGWQQSAQASLQAVQSPAPQQFKAAEPGSKQIPHGLPRSAQATRLQEQVQVNLKQQNNANLPPQATASPPVQPGNPIENASKAAPQLKGGATNDE